MLCKPMVVVAIALALGSAPLSTGASARDGGGSSGGRAFGSSDLGGCFGGDRNGRDGCDGKDDRVTGWPGGSDHGYKGGDAWGHWGGYYGPMVR
jgi:hypothetical protein